ncbi:hypothetical protein J2W42_004228 [Rhizobium tibeticum]|nr:hypothetical protein [Rhizobium tibeticum]
MQRNFGVRVLPFREDVRHLRQQLALADGAMSRGIIRGWKPEFERK